MNTTGELKIKSNSTGKEYTFAPEDAYFEVEHTEEKQQGAERQYVWGTEYNDDESIEITYEVWEYPQGIIEHHNIEVPGFTVITEFDFDFDEPNE